MSLTFDSGALIAFERNDRRVLNQVETAAHAGLTISVPAAVVAQVWRDGRTQARLSRLLKSRVIEIVPLDFAAARAAGQLCGATTSSDVVDASVVICARARGDGIATSDPDDIRRLAPTARIVVV